MLNEFSRTEALLGSGSVERLSRCRVAVFGIGGVGGYTVEALARSGIGALDLIDSDTVSETNINRQLVALRSTVGQRKVDVAAARVGDINPRCAVRTFDCFFLPETADRFDFSAYDYVVDAVDTVSAKVELAVRATAAGVPLIAAMGAGNKLDPTRFRVTDIYKTSGCPLARVMRHELRARGIDRLKVVFSDEQPVSGTVDETTGRPAPASCAFVPSVMGLVIAGEVVRDLTGHGRDGL